MSGDGVAVVVAEDRYAAHDALEAIEVDYDQLPAVVDMEAALEDASPLVRDIPNNRTFTYRADYGDYEATTRGDDVVVVTRRYINQRLIPTQWSRAPSSRPRHRRPER